jgi:hypothetical protein
MNVVPDRAVLPSEPGPLRIQCPIWDVRTSISTLSNVTPKDLGEDGRKLIMTALEKPIKAAQNLPLVRVPGQLRVFEGTLPPHHASSGHHS